jgi:hypothetical protein
MMDIVSFFLLLIVAFAPWCSLILMPKEDADMPTKTTRMLPLTTITPTNYGRVSLTSLA